MLPHKARRTIMDPTATFGPNQHCPARGQTGRGHIAIHARKEQRFICHQCDKTFSATTGTVFYRLRTSAETVVLVVTLLAHGCPVQAIVAAFGFDERTVAAWWPARADRAKPCTSTWSSSHGTWGRSKPMSCASRNRAAS